MGSTNGVSRRGFLCLSASAVGGSLVSRRTVSAQRIPGANDILRLGLIGAGAHGTVLLDELLEIGTSAQKLQIVAVSDLVESRRVKAAKRCGGESVPEWERVIERPDIDAVVVATPHHWHAPIILAALQAGKDVYCEAPMALTVAEAKAVRDMAVRTRSIVQIGTQETSEEQWHAARQAIASGAIGEVVWSQGNCSPSATPPCRPADIEHAQLRAAWPRFARNGQSFDPARFLDWRCYWDYSCGVAVEQHCRKLAPLLMAVGAAFPARVSAAGGVYAEDGRETPDALMMTAEYAGGHSIVLASSQAAGQSAPAVIRGERGTVYCDGSAIRVVEGTHDAGLPGRPRKPQREATAAHLANWLDGIRTRRPCVCNEELGYRTMVAIGMAAEAYRHGATLTWDAKRHTYHRSAPRLA